MEIQQTINVNIQWIDKPEPLNGTVMIIFTDVPEIADNQTAVQKRKEDISQCKAIRV